MCRVRFTCGGSKSGEVNETPAYLITQAGIVRGFPSLISSKAQPLVKKKLPQEQLASPSAFTQPSILFPVSPSLRVVCGDLSIS